MRDADKEDSEDRIKEIISPAEEKEELNNRLFRRRKEDQKKSKTIAYLGEK